MTDQTTEELEVIDWQPHTAYSSNHMVMIGGIPHTLKPTAKNHISDVSLTEKEVSCWTKEAVSDYETMWIPAHLIPVEWEGTCQLQMNVYDVEGTTPVIRYIEKGFNRRSESNSCGFYYALLKYPPLPKVSTDVE